MGKILKSKIFFTLILSCIIFSSFAETIYPTIQNLNSKDPIFKQYIFEVENNYKKIASQKPIELEIYSYVVKESDTLLTIAARCSILYDSIATLNSFPTVDSDLTGKTILLPTTTGLFIPEEASSIIDRFLLERYFDNSSSICYIVNTRKIYFFQNEKFSSTERAFFLDSRMRSPLPDGILSSDFGKRKSPISGQIMFHKGIDLAANEGTPALACLSGVVKFCGWDNTFGNYVIIQHDNNKQSIYAHLKSYTVTKDKVVSTGEVIGFVGSTGASTGPHLHFEIKVGGVATDPQKMLYTN